MRPEHITLAKDGAGDASMVVNFAEELGSESYLHGALPSGESLTVRLAGKIMCAGRNGSVVSRRARLTAIFSQPILPCAQSIRFDAMRIFQSLEAVTAAAHGLDAALDDGWRLQLRAMAPHYLRIVIAPPQGLPDRRTPGWWHPKAMCHGRPRPR